MELRIVRSLICFLILTIFNAFAEEAEEFCIQDGCLIGLTETSRLGRQYHAILGIPYAKPPIGKLRFEPPERPEPWGTLDATNDGKICPQSKIYKRPEDPEGTEDCLYLNVYTPEKKPKKPFPVIVIFHGGGFQYWAGTRDFFPANYLLDGDVVVVSANYRLNVFGFLSTEDEISPGNYGLKDQRFVLQWVQENIKAFGGDPNSVTIQGQDAGAASVHFHILSPSSKGLFHRAIAQSGSALAPWALSLPGEAREHADYLAKYLKCPTDNSSVIVECLRWKSTDELLAADPIFFVWYIDPLVPWKPVVEPEHEGSFLTTNPLQLLNDGNFHDVPLLTGVTSHEGLFRAAGILTNEQTLTNWNVLAIRSYTSALNFYHVSFDEMKDTIVKLRNFYFDSDTVKKEDEKQFVNLFSDRYFFHPLAKSVRLQFQHQKSPIFVYKFERETPGFSFSKIFGFLSDDDPQYGGSCHGDDLLYLHPLEETFFKGLVRDQGQNHMTQRVLELWLNFVTFGNPTPDDLDVVWNSIKSEGIQYLSIRGPDDLEMTSEFYNKRVAFWDELNLDDREILPDSDFLKHDEL